MNKKPSHKRGSRLFWGNILKALFVLVGIFAVYYYFRATFSSPDDVVEAVHTLGVWGPVAMILLVTLEVVIAPIPGILIAISAGYAFGAVWGSVYSYIGNVLGAAIAFWLARRYGRSFIQKFVSRQKLERFDHFLAERGKPLLWICYSFPVLPADIISFVVGLSKIRKGYFMMVILIAYIPNLFLLNLFGAKLYEDGLGSSTIIIGTILLAIFMAGYTIYYLMKPKDHRENRS